MNGYFPVLDNSYQLEQGPVTQGAESGRNAPESSRSLLQKVILSQ